MILQVPRMVVSAPPHAPSSRKKETEPRTLARDERPHHVDSRRVPSPRALSYPSRRAVRSRFDILMLIYSLTRHAPPLLRRRRRDDLSRADDDRARARLPDDAPTEPRDARGRRPRASRARAPPRRSPARATTPPWTTPPWTPPGRRRGSNRRRARRLRRRGGGGGPRRRRRRGSSPSARGRDTPRDGDGRRRGVVRERQVRPMKFFFSPPPYPSLRFQHFNVSSRLVDNRLN